MTKVTFLIGAGASAMAIPTVPSLPAALNKFRRQLSKADLSHQYNDDRMEILKFTHSIINELMDVDLYEKSNEVVLKQASIDTYAKKLYLKTLAGDNEAESKLSELKTLLTLFISFRQLEKPSDLRYDNFFASILNNGALRLPDSLRVVSWNYDTQLENAFCGFNRTGFTFSNAQSVLNVITKNSRFMSGNENRFTVYKINGTAHMLDKNGKAVTFTINKNETLHDYVCRYYSQIKSGDLNYSISFAWERGNNIEEVAAEGIKDTSILVIVGYSLPFFNREIDQKMIKPLPLQKIYIQNPTPGPVRERLMALRPDIDPTKIIDKYETDQFYLPDEMSL